MKLTILLCLTALAVKTTAGNYECSFSNRRIWFAERTLYDCDVISGSIEKLNQKCVESVEGDHLNRHDDEMIESLGISRANTFYMPRGLEKYFPNLISIDIYKVGLLEVHQKDLKPYNNLKYLSFAENKLKHLDGNLFKHNPNLEVILLHKNQIKTVGTVFKNLNNLRNLIFDGNVCSSGTGKTKNEVSNLIRLIYERCEFNFEHALEYCISELSTYKNQWDEFCEKEF